MADLLVIEKSKRKLLIMAEDLVPHIMLNPRPHHMAVIGNIKVTVHFNQNHSNHQNTEADNLTRCLLQRLFHNRTRNIPYNQRNHQCNGCSKHCKKHVGKKQSLIWNVIPRQLADSSLLFSGFFFFTHPVLPFRWKPFCNLFGTQTVIRRMPF